MIVAIYLYGMLQNTGGAFPHLSLVAEGERGFSCSLPAPQIL